jgi:YidC/Oxa1 family membrane protein insertase
VPILASVIQEAFSPLISVFQTILVFVHQDVVGGSWGLAIIGLTVLIRAILVPLTFSQFRSMQRMQVLAPEMKALQQKYKDDKQRQQQEIMKFYKENKVNPLASCLPMALQLPVFISLFYMLRTDLKKHICGSSLLSHYNLHHKAVASVAALPSKYIEKTACNSVAAHSAKFLFIPDITSKATGVVLVVLLVLYVGSQLASTLLMTASADASQRRLMLAFPLFLLIILYRYPAGLLVYWITTNLWTLVQQYIVRRQATPPVLRPPSLGGSGEESSSNGTTTSKRGGVQPALAGAGTSAPPPSARKKKKRSGRRR